MTDTAAITDFADGGYPLLYLTSDDDVLCAQCAQREADAGGKVTSFLHLEGADIYCDECSGVTESAYGDPWAEDTEQGEVR